MELYQKMTRDVWEGAGTVRDREMDGIRLRRGCGREFGRKMKVDGDGVLKTP